MTASSSDMSPCYAPRVSRSDDKFMLRLPEGMRANISEAARLNGRSMNAEIVQRLAESFDDSEDTRVAQLLHMLNVENKEIRERIDRLDQYMKAKE